MSYSTGQFQAEIALAAGTYKWYPTTKAELTLLSTAIGTDTTTHDTTMETALGILQPGKWSNTGFQNAIDLIINKGKGGNLTAAQMAAALTAVAATLP
jgi:hypothetical protein